MSLEEPIAGLWATSPARLPFDNSVLIRAFVLQRAHGNAIVYNAPGLASAAADVRALGGATRQLINHGHEAMFAYTDLDAPVFVHERDREEAARSLPIAGTFSERQMLDDDLEAIPIPGHTPGATAFLWDNGAHRFLFTGDSVTIEHGRWCAVVLDQRARESYLRSLALMSELDFDVLVPWGVMEGEPFVDTVSQAEGRKRIDAISARLEAGENR